MWISVMLAVSGHVLVSRMATVIFLFYWLILCLVYHVGYQYLFWSILVFLLCIVYCIAIELAYYETNESLNLITCCIYSNV